MKQFTARHPWAILAAGAAIQILTGLPAAWGVFQQPVMDEFSLTEDGAGYAFGILIAAFGVGCVIGGFCRTKRAALRGAVGHRPALRRVLLRRPPAGEKGAWFWAVFSIPAGLGTAFLYRPSSPAPRNGTPGARALPRGSLAARWAERCVPDRIRPHGAEGLWPGAGDPGGVLGAGGAHAAGLPYGQCPAHRPAPGKAEARRTGQGKGHPGPRPCPAADAQNKTVLALRRSGLLFHPGGAAVQPHHLKAGHGAGPGRGRCPVECGAGQRGQRGGPLADAPAQRPDRPPPH